MAAISVAPLSALLQDLTLLVTAIGLLCGDMSFRMKGLFCNG